ncbi:MAG: toprim domain-containing protein [Gammaproteobacteria bacterium]|nr:toprim domain-containing protein [Gammaproteobacteria bacterium]MBU1479393.1 toprim domain-containing protein [Gammaproteobacteria bacterium]MBU2002101.1 toprim domain-containing protein [Gammaproteobacteria bacterium]MBU2133228.1 toprim domain-containing protein [Gammaproteobacteria bacterium]MBU2187372.1 toprim domain-containing protein [Gammaproteobacteria bacterium]
MTTVFFTTSNKFDHETLNRIGLDGVKAHFDLPDIICELTGNEIKSTTSDYCQLEDDICPFCGHEGCFKIYHADPDDQNYHCYSCEEHGDIYSFLIHMDLADNAYHAANKLLNGEIKGITINTQPKPKKVKPEKLELTEEQYQRRQELLEAAFQYYIEPMIADDSKPLAALMEKRKIRKDVLIDNDIGYSHGQLWRALATQGFSLEEMCASGLVKEGQFNPTDFFPSGVYIFPHYDEDGDFCRFTFKDPKKEKQYQLPKQYWLNDIQFYGQHLLDTFSKVAIVEGEHDLLALLSHNWEGVVLATNGQLSQDQLTWIKQNLQERKVFTFFDSDAAGNKYREKIAELGLSSLIQVSLPEGQGKDIDDYLRREDALPLDELVNQYGVSKQPVEVFCKPVVNQDNDLPNLMLVPDETIPTIWAAFNEDSLNDVGNADRLKAITKDNMMYVPELNNMLSFNGKHWAPSSGQELEYTRCVGERLISQAKSLLEEAIQTKNKVKLAEAEQLQKFGRMTLNRKKMMDMLEIFKSGNQISANSFDANPMLLGVNNGVLDLAHGKLLPAQKEMYISRYSSINYDSEATCPRWLEFIDEITCGDKEFARFLQRIVGYILTGLTDEQVLFFLHGHGCNGKSTFMNVIQRLMGSYYHQISSDVLLQTNNSGKGPNPSLAKLNGSRLVVANELPEGSRMDENLVKSMTGDDMLVARQLYAKVELEFRPMFKLIMVGNHKPVIRDTSPGMWRRMVMLPFNASFSQEQMDPRLMDKLYAELSGILNWTLEGVQMWLKDGIKASIPDSIKSGIEEYRHESDLLAMFLEECTCEGDFVYTDELYENFRKWAERDGDWKMTRNIMTKRLVEKGFEKGRYNSKAMIKGIKLKSYFDDIIELDPEPRQASKALWSSASGISPDQYII